MAVHRSSHGESLGQSREELKEYARSRGLESPYVERAHFNCLIAC